MAGPGQASSRRVELPNSVPAPLVWRAPEGPEGTGGIRGAAPNKVRTPNLAGGRTRAGHSQPQASPDWRPPRGLRGLAGLRDDAPSEARSADGSRAGRRPPAHTAAGPSGARNTSGATSTNSQRGGLAGGQATRRPEIRRGTATPEHQRGHRQQNRPAHRGRAVQSVSETHRRITTISGSPRPLSWRTLEIPSLAATSLAVPSMRGSS